MDRRWLYVIGALAVVGAWFFISRKNNADVNPPEGASEAASAQANYTLPPDIGAQVDNTGGVNFPNGTPAGTNVIYTNGKAQSLPMNS